MMRTKHARLIEVNKKITDYRPRRRDNCVINHIETIDVLVRVKPTMKLKAKNPRLKLSSTKTNKNSQEKKN